MTREEWLEAEEITIAEAARYLADQLQNEPPEKVEALMEAIRDNSFHEIANLYE